MPVTDTLPYSWTPRPEYRVFRQLNSHLTQRFVWKTEAGVARPAPQGLQREIDRSRHSLLNLAQDWDGEGARPIQSQTFDRAATQLHLLNTSVRQTWGERMPVPMIGPCSDGSLDIFWKTARGTLLINFSADPSESAAYSGADSSGQRIKGCFDPSLANQSVVAWLMTILGK